VISGSTYTTLRDLLYNTSKMFNDVMSDLWSKCFVYGVNVLSMVLFHDVIPCFTMTDHVLV
jgi:hypothetical protein